MVTGWVDWFGIPSGTRAKRIGTLHGAGNMVTLVLFVATWFWRVLVSGIPTPDLVAVALSALGVIPEAGGRSRALSHSAASARLTAVTGSLGGELVDRLAIGVDRGAHPDSPNALSLAASPLRP